MAAEDLTDDGLRTWLDRRIARLVEEDIASTPPSTPCQLVLEHRFMHPTVTPTNCQEA